MLVQVAYGRTDSLAGLAAVLSRIAVLFPEGYLQYLVHLPAVTALTGQLTRQDDQFRQVPL